MTETLGAAIGCIPSGLFIVSSTTDKTAVMLASWVQQAGFEPPTVTIAVNKTRAIAAVLTPNNPVVINVLEKGQGKLVGHFAKGFEPDADPWAGVDVEFTSSGQPYLIEAIAYMEGNVSQVMDAGDHTIVLVALHHGARLREGEPATHTRKNGFKY